MSVASDVVAGAHDELTIDTLAQRTGMTVRNIRAHQSRGLLPPPEVRARTGYYGPEHVARLELIREMQADGYNLEAIRRLLGGADGAAGEVLGFRRALTAPFESEMPEVLDQGELAARFGAVGPETLARAEELGVIRPLGEGRFEVPSPILLRAADELIGRGVPVPAALGLVERLRDHCQGVSEAFIGLFLAEVLGPFRDAGYPSERWPEVREAIERLRPLASEALVAVFQQTMTEAVEAAFGRALSDDSWRIQEG